MRRTHGAVARRVAGGVAVALAAGGAVIALGVAIEHPSLLSTACARAEGLGRAADAFARTSPVLAGLGAAGAVARARRGGILRCMEALGAPRWPWGAWSALLGACAGAAGERLGALGGAGGPGWARVPGAWVRGTRVLADVASSGVAGSGAPAAEVDPWPALVGALCGLVGAWLASRPRGVSAPAPCSAP
jgi:hypothetical protein